MSGTLHYEYGQLAELVAILGRVAAEVSQSREDLLQQTAAARSGDTWKGAAQEAWSELQTSYDQLTAHISQVIGAFSGGVDQAQQIARQTDQGLANLFG